MYRQIEPEFQLGRYKFLTSRQFTEFNTITEVWKISPQQIYSIVINLISHSKGTIKRESKRHQPWAIHTNTHHLNNTQISRTIKGKKSPKSTQGCRQQTNLISPLRDIDDIINLVINTFRKKTKLKGRFAGERWRTGITLSVNNCTERSRHPLSLSKPSVMLYSVLIP